MRRVEPQASNSSGALCRARTRRLYSAGSLSHSSAAWPLRGLELLYFCQSMSAFKLHNEEHSYLFGSPSRLCRLSNTVVIL